jgi:hypothetical protein
MSSGTSQRHSLSSEVIEQAHADYRRDGFAIVRRVFSLSEVLDFRRRCDAVRARVSGRISDLLSYPEFLDVVLDARVLSVARAVLGSDIVYFGDSTFVANSRADNHLHNDARGDVWDPARSEYPIIRLGIYLQDHTLFSDGLKVRPGSHRSVFWTQRNLFRLAGVGGQRLSLKAFRPRWFYNVPSEPGDLVFWNLRTHHSAHAVRLRRLDPFALPSAVDSRLPSFLRKPPPSDRYAMFMSLGAPSEALHRFIRELGLNPHYRPMWEGAAFDRPEVRSACEAAGVTLDRDVLDLWKLT